jgi:hypothetical protein
MTAQALSPRRIFAMEFQFSIESLVNIPQYEFIPTESQSPLQESSRQVIRNSTFPLLRARPPRLQLELRTPRPDPQRSHEVFGEA